MAASPTGQALARPPYQAEVDWWIHEIAARLILANKRDPTWATLAHETAWMRPICILHRHQKRKKGKEKMMAWFSPVD